MIRPMIDLHTHTSASDGTFSLGELASEAARVGLRAVAVTDHDTVACAKRISAKMLAAKGPLRIIPGIELSVFDHGLGYLDIHILGLFIDPNDKPLSSRLRSLAKEREDQKKATVRKLKELGYSISFKEVKAKAAGSVGRPHIAKELMEKYPLVFPTIQSAFEKLLGNGRPAYAEREAGFSLKEAVDLIHGAGGLAILAHPFMYGYDPRKLARDFKSCGGDGIETYYDYVMNRPENRVDLKGNAELQAKARSIASEFGLLESGGSDFHGKNKSQSLGDYTVPDDILDKMEAALGKRRETIGR